MGERRAGTTLSLPGVVVVLVVAKLAGITSVLGASEWAKDQEALLRQQVQLRWKAMPCANPDSSALARLDSQPVNATLTAWFVGNEAESRCGHEPSRFVAQADQQHGQLAIDGKAARGTGKQADGGEKPQKQVLPVYEVQTGIVVQPCPILQEHTEVSPLKAVLTEGLCTGRILSSDAAQAAITTLDAWSSEPEGR